MTDEDEEIISDVIERLKGYSPAISIPPVDEYIDPATQITFTVTMSREWLDTVPAPPSLVEAFDKTVRRER